jgi:hypothetical protein
MTHRLDAGKRRLRALVSTAADARPIVPLVHTTDSYILEDVLADGQLEPQSCKVFTGEVLTYFFYGRPAFPPNVNAEPTSLKHYFPICIIFKPEWTPAIRRVFPFDSGAFTDGLYGAYLHKRMKLGDFGLEPDATTPGKVISQFFGSVGAYLKGESQIAVDADAAQFEAHSYLAMVRSRGGNAIDSRGSGIEIQTSELVPVHTIAAIVLPSTFADGVTGQKLKSLGIDMLPYRTIERTRPNEYMSQITTLCLNYYVRLHLVNESDL